MDLLDELINALRCLPGVGPKSAQRMVFHLLKHKRQQGLNLAHWLTEAMQNIRHCVQCHNFSESTLCRFCRDPNRALGLLCVVEHPADILAIEQSQCYQGRYFVLMGKISPLDGMGPEDIGLPRLKALVAAEHIKEVILALSPSVEGQTTSHFIHQLLSEDNIQLSQLAQGIPSGGELEFLDANTIGHALRNRAVLASF